jgi:hypothetical protein
MSFPPARLAPRFLALPVLSLLSLLAACGGSIASPDENEINGGSGGSGDNQCTAAPSCDPDSIVRRDNGPCEADSLCYERTLCGQTIRCARAGGPPPPPQCAAYPSCKDGYVEVSPAACSKGGCVSETLCGATIYCAAEVNCDAYPSCDAGHTPVKSPSACWEDDAVCYSRSLCGVTIWCTGPSAPDGGPQPLPDGGPGGGPDAGPPPAPGF